MASLLHSTLLGSPIRLHAEKLPDIDAQEFDVTPLETSTSGRVYRFRVDGANPRTGSIILVRKGDTPIAAFRILKTEGTDIVGKRVRKYESQLKLEMEERYVAVEKITDLVEPVLEPKASPATAPIAIEGEMVTPGPAPEAPPPAPKETAEAPPYAPEKTEPEEEASEFPEASPEGPPADPDAVPLLGDDGSSTLPGPQGKTSPLDRYDEALDSTTTPRDLRLSPSADSVPAGIGAGVVEKEPLSKFKNMVGISVGNYRNMSGFSIPGTTNNGVSAYYNWVTEDSVWLEGHAPHDTLALEVGLGYYSRVNLNGIFDNYSVIPIRGEFVYSLHLSPTFAALTHVGAQYNWVFAAENAVEEGLSALSGIQANLGVGFLYQMGPQWYIRGDAGLDRFSIGLAVKW